MTGVRLSHVMIDARDPDALATFWTGLLDTEVEARVDDERFVFLRATEGVPAIGLQRVSEPKETKNRVHVAWRVMADPEGNEFCIVPGSD